MSNSLPARENASPLVRTESDVPSLGHHDLEIAPQPQATGLGSVGFNSPTRPQNFTSRPSYKAIDKGVAQLSERESIFATHYLTSDSNASTPRLPPTIEGSKNDRNQDVTLHLELPGPLATQARESPLLLRSRHPTTSVTSPSTLTSQLLRSKSEHTEVPQQSIDAHVRDFERRHGGYMVNETSTSTDDLHRRSSVASEKQRPIKTRSQTGYTLRMSSTRAQSDVGNRVTQVITDGSRQQWEEQLEREIGNPSSNKSLNDGTAEPQEQQIEATLASEEPTPNVRSRKASHYLGIFKEKNGSQDHKKHKERAKDTSKTNRAQVTDSKLNDRDGYKELEISSNDGGKASGATHWALDEESTFENPKQTKIAENRPHYSRHGSSQDSSKPLSQFSNSTSSSVHETCDELVGDEKSIEWRSDYPPQGTLPLRFLEEIRNHASLSSSGQQAHSKESSGSSSEPTSETYVIEDKSREGLTTHQVLNEEQCRLDAEDGEESESDKEHIASATYYPHQVPAPNKLLNHHHTHGGKPVVSAYGQPEPQTVAFDDTGKDVIHESSDSSLVLQSKGKVHSIQHDYQRAQPLLDTEEYKQLTGSSISSISDTDYDSWDDTARIDGESGSSLTDNGELTPTATPHARPKLQNHSTREPLGAVELKPYKHQVGGHSKVFSFSKQAICKQLNNRENEFYEVIERRHPELLRFLPKYLGVLNVTYQKAHKQKRKQALGAEPTYTEDQASVQQNNKAAKFIMSANGEEHMSRIPSLRTISRSRNYEFQDEAVPKVIYANNLHIIPNNLFQSVSQGGKNNRPQTSQGIVTGSRRNSTRQKDFQWEDDELTSESINVGRPSLHKSYPSWGATTVNTKFKEKVLREVFSPPRIHQHHRRRQRSDFSRLQIESNEKEASQEIQTHTRYRLTASSDEKLVKDRRRPFSGIKGTIGKLRDSEHDQSEWRSGSAPVAGNTNATLAMLHRVQSTETERAVSTSNGEKKIRRRRSGGGLRREQVDLADSGRGNFKYFEDQYGNDKAEDIFSMDLGSHEAPITDVLAKKIESKSESKKTDPNSSHIDEVGERSTDAALHSTTIEHLRPSQLLTQGPSNPVEAQQQSDERVRHFLLLEDLTANMLRPCVLDLKMGTRQYGIEATKKKQMSQRQKCKSTTSRQLGVRLCGMQVWNARSQDYAFEDKYAGRDLKAGREFQDALMRFLCDGTSVVSVLRHIPPLLEKLSRLEKFIVDLPGYRFYASSLLMLYDGQEADGLSDRDSKSNEPSHTGREKSGKLPLSDIDIKLVDFANCVTGEDNLPDDTLCPPKDKNGVDRGYIRGLRTLRTYLQRVWSEINGGEWVERGEGEAMGLSMNGAGKKRDQPDWWQESYEEDPGEVST